MILRLILLTMLVFGVGCGRREAVDGISVRFWHGIESPGNNRLLEEKVRVFESENPGITITLENIGAQDRAIPRIMTALSARMPPELLWLAPVYTGRIAASGRLVPAENFIKRDPDFDSDDIYEGILESGMYDGKLYTVPFETNCLAVYYNKEHFAGAGITDIPGTWQEFRSAAARLTEYHRRSGRPESYGMLLPIGTEEWTVWTWQTFLWQAGGRILDESTGMPLFHGEPGVAALNYWLDLIYTDESAVFSERNAGYKLEPFLTGRVSMMINGPWNYPLLEEQEEVDYGSFPLPRGRESATNIGGENLYIFKSTPEQEEAAWKFARYIMSEEFQVEWAIQTGYLPVNKKAAESETYRRFLEENPFVRTFVESMDFGRSRPPVREYSRLSDRIGRALESALYRSLTPEEALEEAARDAEGFL